MSRVNRRKCAETGKEMHPKLLARARYQDWLEAMALEFECSTTTVRRYSLVGPLRSRFQQWLRDLAKELELTERTVREYLRNQPRASARGENGG